MRSPASRGPAAEPDTDAAAPRWSSFPAAQSLNGLDRRYLHPGFHLATIDPTLVTTILGSCVAVCLWDPVTGAGGMNHYLLPFWAGGTRATGRYGNVAIEELVADLLDLGSNKADLRAKVFGGGSVLRSGRGSPVHLGLKNVETAFATLREHRIPVEASSVGGRHGRKVLFQTDDGTAWVKTL